MQRCPSSFQPQEIIIMKTFSRKPWVVVSRFGVLHAETQQRILLWILVVGFAITLFLQWYIVMPWLDAISTGFPVLRLRKRNNETTVEASSFDSMQLLLGPCVILFFGLPRKFQHMVLPGVINNVIRPNVQHRCDYYVHYYNDTFEERYSRGADAGRGGILNPAEIKLLERAILTEHENNLREDPQHEYEGKPIIKFVQDSDHSFWERYQSLLQDIHSRKGPDGKLLYIPLSEKNPFPNETIVNIIKMWHSQEAAWKLMESSSSSKHYSRVAMLRSDVLYVTPINIYQLPDGTTDIRNQHAVAPGFGTFPVSDRMMYGPWDAMQIWAAGRFRRLERHVHRVAKMGDGIHSEKFLFHTIFPAIRNAGVPIWKANSDLCFLRIRADDSVRIRDCGRDCVTDHNKKVVEHILQRACTFNATNPDVPFLECNEHLEQHPFGPTKYIQWDGCTWKV